MRGFFLSDEELGKKDDDHKPFKNGGGLRQPNWNPARVPPRRSLKRIALVLVVASIVYLFIKNIPVLGPNAQMRRPSYTYPDFSTTLPRHPASDRSQAAPPKPQALATTPERIFNGPVRFLELAPTLHGISGTRGNMVINRNVLFAASSLRSAATLLPIACQMGSDLKSYVHFALMSRSDIDIQELRKVNGIDDSCQIIFHDARPDYPQISTDDRMETAVFRAFHHIFNYMHPQAIFIDGSIDEETFFLRAAQQHSKAKKNTLIELPRRSAKRLEWLTKLDSQALRMWHKIHIDILIHAIPGASGSLIRLLRSLSAADYTSSSVPHLTIELPHDIDPPTKRFLETFTWPPAHVYNPTNARYLSLRHRIPHQRMNEEESSARFLESFWPAQPEYSHILVLSPQVELSPDFFHYLKYSLLEYRYSAVSTYQHWDRRLFGISLEQPNQLLDGKGAFTPPSLLKSTNSGDPSDEEISTSFLWQAPTSNAVLFLGERWMELHDFVSRSLEAKQESDPVPALLSEKIVSTQYPSWLEHALRLARARGYWMLYPGDDTARNLATVHSELNHLPEEYASHESSKPLLADDASEEEIENVRQKIRTGIETPLAPVSLLDSLPNKGNLRPFNDLPIVTWNGRSTDLEELDALSAKYSAEFREKVGGCGTEPGKKEEREPLSAQDMFCSTD
ncbi:uncharacterized protein F4807DRAFT_459153 [Annulohypoxylon truncatum]|uniref:uncharacterized protein n=1 Tax=Annulohypoxylon truncatum TaxID=327061 RepID=UPI0020084CA9|nr:uncharacterized protein F4807DRAFT_459153 [Annulohypoxylon truncatum]KAI1210924.1 hypothetical protein F4807DRAFT_459153 [Annulohypoxylon truncatum]